MKDFKFFKGTLDMMDGDVRATASLHNPFNNNEMERYYYDRQLGRFETVRPTLNQEEVTRRINGGGTGNQIKLYQATKVTTVNPKWWMKIKMFFQTISLYWDQIWGIIILATIVTVTFGLMIAKVLYIW
jgi:hypothetical protein